MREALRSTLILFAAMVAMATTKAPVDHKKGPSWAEAQKSFVNACLGAFASSSGHEPSDAGKKICDCTATEAKSQGAKVQALVAETDKIRANPKYEIKDKHVMDAFRWCTIETFHQISDEIDAQSPPQSEQH